MPSEKDCYLSSLFLLLQLVTSNECSCIFSWINMPNLIHLIFLMEWHLIHAYIHGDCRSWFAYTCVLSVSVVQFLMASLTSARCTLVRRWKVHISWTMRFAVEHLLLCFVHYIHKMFALFETFLHFWLLSLYFHHYIYHTLYIAWSKPPLPSNRHHRRCGDCLEGKGENYQVRSVQYCVQQLCTVRCTHIWTD